MMPYVVYLAMSLVLILIIQKLKYRKIAFAISLSVLFVFSTLFIGMRNASVGYDTEKYLIPIFNKMVSGWNVQDVLKHTATEIGFSYLVKGLSLISSNYNVCLIGLAFLGNIGFFVFAYVFRLKIEPKYVLLCFVGLYSIYCFNTIRQCIAISLFMIMICVLDGIRMSRSRKIIISLILIVAGSLIHRTMLVSIPILLMRRAFLNNGSRKEKTIIMVIILYALVIFSLMAVQFISYFGDVGLLSEKYSNYTNSKDYHSAIEFDVTILITKVILLAMAVMASKREKGQKMNSAIIYMLLVDISMFMVSFHLRNTYRLTWSLFFPSATYALSHFYEKKIKKKDSKIMYDIFAVVLTLGFFLIKVLLNTYGLLPYKTGAI